MNCESIGTQKTQILAGEESNQKMGHFFFFFLFCFSSVGICSNWFSLWIFVSVVAFTSFSLTTHRNNSKTDDFHQLAESASLAYPNQLHFILQYFRYST